jgi:hypothetical protein
LLFNISVSSEEEPYQIYKYSIVPTVMRLNNHYYTIYCIWLNFIFNGMGPFIVLITLNTLMLIELKKMTAENEQVMLWTPHFWVDTQPLLPRNNTKTTSLPLFAFLLLVNYH